MLTESRMPEKAAFIVSLDLELYWGVRFLHSLDRCRERLLQVRPAIARILELFEEYDIHATWAGVGLLFFQNRDELLEGLPAVKPDYNPRYFSPYDGLPHIGRNEAEDPFHYGPSILRAILDTRHQEIATHTFSHYYCLEDGQTEEAFRSDLEAALRAAAKWKLDLRSLVFPCNQVNANYLELLRRLGIQSYRGAGSHWIYRERKRSEESWLRRGIRLLDAYLNLSGHHTVGIEEIRPGPPYNFPASRLLRPYWHALRMFEPLRLERISAGLEEAAQKGRIYHLWFHPEDLAMDMEQNLKALKTVLSRYAALRERGRMESVNMGELSARLLARAPQAEAGKAAPACALAASR
jgi:peptidoglycan/xylan/chitin deacetylase (PgdA/CDA1 family)